MADISITRKHELPHTRARAAAQSVADRMAREYDMQAEWAGQVLRFERSGVSGTLTLHASEVRLEITLGFLFKAFASRIEEQAVKNMEKVFGG